jgi:hypothetical protein
MTRYLGRSLVTPDDPVMIQVDRRLLELAFAVSLLRNPFTILENHRPFLQ